ncbi:MAG TPA: adenylyltransferase/cytidyltransferase family protein [Candidatus Absconditabacterales bacterium]|nr:adenylyltransferase/cytidyltransferase family protein [Candidatus Absconditabacterales bacterium]HRU50044.1 adenylyltransferase/cytidyltransferase family protein [Candidatus Absconditabacterales bacterium]
MKKVITFGAFDLVHEGHKFFLEEAKKYGDFLITIVARDKTIQKVKGKAPLHKEQKRLKDIQSLGIADIVELGHQADMMFAIKKHKPDIVAIGYDQNSFIYELSKFLKENKLKTNVVTIDPYKENIYKSSKLKKQLT